MKKNNKKDKLSEVDIKASQKNFPNILAGLEKTYPNAHCALNHGNPLQLLVATILSAQCTDKRVNMVTPVLFTRFPDARALAEADLDELMKIIKSTGFYRNKAKNIKGAAQKIVQEFNGKVPENMEDLLTLPGVARKTANVVLWNAFGKNEGIVVDTHVGRTSRRLGLTGEENPVKVEAELMNIVPRAKWGKLSHLLIDLGRDVCKAPNPLCSRCKISGMCPWFKKVIIKSQPDKSV